MKSVTDFKKMKQENEKITMITAYDFPSAKLVQEANTDLILVGDSLGMVVLGYDSTIPVTVADMVHHAKAVRRGAPETFVVVDMPFASYHYSDDETLRAAVKMMQEASGNAVKLEGDHPEKISLLVSAGIPVVAHLGLTPQAVGVLGGYKVQGKSEEAAKQIIESAKRLEAAGAFMLVLECVPEVLACRISELLTIPTIGIGAGKFTDGQVLVYHDILQYGVDRLAKFVKPMVNLNQMIVPALQSFNKEVKLEQFPNEDYTFQTNKEQLAFLYGGKNHDSKDN